MNSSTVLVTGATGFIASHIILQLLQQGYSVIGTVRPGKSQSARDAYLDSLSRHTAKTEHFSFRFIDLLDPLEKWVDVMDGVDYVLHVASPFPSSEPEDESDIIEPAVRSTNNVLEAAHQVGVKKVVITSSTAAIMYGNGKRGEFDETNWTNAENKDDTTAYFRSKTLAERSAWDFRGSHQDLRLSTIQPGFVLGPLLMDNAGTSVEVVKMFMQGKYPAVPKVGYPSVDVRSVAQLHIMAMESSKADGQRLACVSEYLSFKDIAVSIKKHFPEYKASTLELPNILVRVLALFDSNIKTIVNDLNAKRQVSSKKARQLLGWKPIDMDQSIKDCGQSLIDLELV